MVTVTDKAKNKVEQLMSENELDKSYFLRVSVQAPDMKAVNEVLDAAKSTLLN